MSKCFNEPLHEKIGGWMERKKEIWHVPCLNYNLKLKLLSASAKALTICWKKLDPFVSFEALHMISKRATPEKLMQYKLALCLHKIYNTYFNSMEFLRLDLKH